MKFLPLLALLLVGGCDNTPSKPSGQTTTATSQEYWAHCQGTVRGVYYASKDRPYSYVVVETDEGWLFTVRLLDEVPPVWVGLRGRFAYESGGNRANGLWKNFIVTQRLPDTLEAYPERRVQK